MAGLLDQLILHVLFIPPIGIAGKNQNNVLGLRQLPL